jgi:hypothetical protein
MRDGDATATAGVEQALARLEQDDPSTAADLEAIRLAVRHAR